MPAGEIAAVVLAAGQSRRMGQPKMALPWGEQTVIQKVIGTLRDADIQDIVVVTGGARERVEGILAGEAVQLVHNPDYARSEMLTSLQVGIRALSAECQALLVVLGDQPTIEAAVIRAVCQKFWSTGAALVAPSYQMRRGHPWLAARSLWQALLDLPAEQTMRDFLHAQAEHISYVAVNTPGILKDLDTPEDYNQQKPRSEKD